MRGKIIFVVGLATGYVLGTRAGRERYEQIKAGAGKIWNTPAVQSGVQSVQDFAGSRVDQVKADLSQKARNALAALIGRDPLAGPQQSRAAAAAGSTKATTAKKPVATKAPAKKPAAKSTSSTVATSTAAKPATPAASESDE